MIQKLLSLPENLVSSFYQITGKLQENWFVLSDPEDFRIGSGGGTAYLLAEHKKQSCDNISFQDYASSSKKIIIHAGGQSRRLPSYAPSGKLLTPIPVFQWSRGQKIDQTLLDLHIPLLEKVMDVSGKNQNCLIASGDVLIQAPEIPFELPDADVVCFGIWVDPQLASHHGVFFTPRNNPHHLDFMLQKPEHKVIESLTGSHLYLMDIGIWVLSDRAVEVLMKKCGWNGTEFTNKLPAYYDLYSTFGTSLGENPSDSDVDISQLTTAIVPMNKGEFFHYGTSHELISSTEKIQNRVLDQRNIWHYRVKPHPSVFVQNSITDIKWESYHSRIWIENCHIPSTWQLIQNHIFTGVPENQWQIKFNVDECLDIIPIGEDHYCIRTYFIADTFRGDVLDENTLWMDNPVKKWLEEREINPSEAGLERNMDIQNAALFPVISRKELSADMIKWMLHGDLEGNQKKVWLKCRKLSADQILSLANLKRLFIQRESFNNLCLKKIANNYKHSIFYQTDLKHAAVLFANGGIELPDLLPVTEPAILRSRDHMFRSEVLRLKGKESRTEEENAFKVLQVSIADLAYKYSVPKLSVFSDQIVWGRSPLRMDLAGGWSDTPPYCLQTGGSVLNMAVELNGQPPIQVFIRLCPERKITLRSIDNGLMEVITSFSDLQSFNQIGSVFSIPKVALCLSGFVPDYCGVRYNSLEEQLNEFGGGFEISLLAAVPKGSGLGTSSILAATLIGSLSDFCSLDLDHQAICQRTLILEQLLTTGGGWQDQFGGILPGIKLLESEPGMQEKINIRWMPDRLFTHAEYKENWLLYYTGITRVAKNILAEIVRGMFLNEGHRLMILDEIKQHAYRLAEGIQKSDFDYVGRMISHSWKLNNSLDSGTNSPEIQQIISQIEDYSLGFKLLGAGGGGYMLICSKDPQAAAKIQSILIQNPTNSKARFVNMEVSQAGFQVSRS